LRIRNVYPGFQILAFIYAGSRIQQQQQKREKNFYLKMSQSSQKYGFGIQDPGKTYPESWILGDSGFKKAPDPGFGSATLHWIPDRICNKEFKYFNPRKLMLSSQKYDSGCSSQDPDFFHPGSGSRIHGSKKALDPGARSDTLLGTWYL
jgi:hypothetical protein